MALYIDNAISWSQWRLRGGLKNLVLIAVAYLVLVAFFITLYYQLSENSSNKMFSLQVSSVMILVFQVILLLPLGGLVISHSLRRDVTNRLIESHRLMPLAPTQAIVGYIVGSGTQIVALALVNLFIGAILSNMRALPVRNWLMANVLIVVFSVAIWTALAMAAFVSRAVLGLLIGIFMGIIFSGGTIFVIAPGLLAFCSPMHGSTVFDFASLGPLPIGTFVALVAQCLMAVLCIRGAARKYADGGALGLTLGPSLAALGIWAGLTWFGIYDFHELRPAMLDYQEISWRVLVVGGVASCLLFALLPIAALAITRNRQPGGRGVARTPALLATLAVCLLFILAPLSSRIDSVIYYGWRMYNPAPIYSTTRNSNGALVTYMKPGPAPTIPPHTSIPILIRGSSHLGMIAAVCAVFLLQSYLLMRLLYPAMKRANLLLLFIIAALWFVPLVADVIYYGSQNQDPRLDVFGPYSPLGAISQALDHPARRTWIGILAQAALCVAIAVLTAVVQWRRRTASKAVALKSEISNLTGGHS